MVKTLSYIESTTTDPYSNLALEKYLFDHVQEEEVILYLWQNQRTVVCGRNQNLWKECNVSRLLEAGGHPVRRLSGGGAVFHDLGNLNFTFLVNKVNYDVDRQLTVILEACRSFGIQAEKTGRNDITIDGRKFSGNAFYKSKGHCYHHGTIMVSVDKSMLSTYLNVDPTKLQSKGVASVKARVANLTDFCPTLTISQMKERLRLAFEQVYELPSQTLEPDTLDQAALAENRATFQSEDWLYGKNVDFAFQISRRFPWGDFDLRLNVENGKIVSSALYSDANDESFIRSIGEQLDGLEFSYQALCPLLEQAALSEAQREMVQDIQSFLLASI